MLANVMADASGIGNVSPAALSSPPAPKPQTYRHLLNNHSIAKLNSLLHRLHLAVSRTVYL
jgi:hypothetical protein